MTGTAPTPDPAPGPRQLRTWTSRAAGVAALAVGAGLLTLVPGGAPAAQASLVPWSDCDQLLEHYRRELAQTATPWGVGGGGVAYAVTDSAGARSESVTAVAAPPVAATAGGGSLGPAVGPGGTGTNLQETGVDEPDTVKVRGGLLVAAAGGRLQLLRAGAEPQLLSSVPLGEGVDRAELLVDGDRVLAVAQGWSFPEDVPLPEPLPVEPAPEPVEPVPAPKPVDPVPPVEPPLPVDPVDPEAPTEPLPLPPGEDPAVPLPSGAGPASGAGSAPAPGALVAPPPPGPSISLPAAGVERVHVVLVDVADPAAPVVLERLEVDGRYLSARLVDGAVRLLTTSAPQVTATTPAEPFGAEEEEAALAENRAAAESVGLEDVLPQVVRRDAAGAELAAGPAVACDDVRHPGSGAVGASTLLVTTLRPSAGLAPVDTTAVTTDGDLVYASADRLYVATSRWGVAAPVAESREPDGRPRTELHAFDTTSPDTTDYVGSGSVDGWVYGRWALSEHRGDLRVATTLDPPWGGGGPAESSVVVLGERDGELVERGRVDGLGRDERISAVRYFGDIATVVTFRQTDPLYVLDLGDPDSPRLLGELKVPGFSTYLHPLGDDRLLGVGHEADSDGRITGVQLSVFDLTDLSAPTQVDRLQLGEGWSPALDDSRAFGYDPLTRLAVLPFGTWDVRTGLGENSALSVRVTDDFRLELAGRLDVGATTAVERVLLAGGLGYAVTPQGVVAVDPATMRRLGETLFQGVPPPPPLPEPVPLPEPLPGPVPPPGTGTEPGAVPGGLPAPDVPSCAVSSDGTVTCSGGAGSGAPGGTEPGAAPGGG